MVVRVLIGAFIVILCLGCIVALLVTGEWNPMEWTRNGRTLWVCFALIGGVYFARKEKQQPGYLDYTSTFTIEEVMNANKVGTVIGWTLSVGVIVIVIFIIIIVIKYLWSLITG